MNATIELLQSHRSIRKFKDAPLSDETVQEIIKSGQAAATSSNVQAVTVIQVTNDHSRQALAELAGGQPYVATAGAFFVFCADLHRSAAACESQGGTFSEGMTEHFMIATIDVALFAQNCVVAAESLGLGICYIGGLRNNPQGVADLLELPNQVYPVFGLCIGEPAQNPEIKPRLPLSAVLMQERYSDAEQLNLVADYDQSIQHYYQTRTGGNKSSTWSEEMKALVGKESRPHMKGFLAGKGFTMR